MLKEAELGTSYPPPWSEGTAGVRISDAKSPTRSHEMETNLPEEARMAKRNTTRPISRNGRELSPGQQTGAAARESKRESCPASLCQYWQREDAMQCSQTRGHKPAVREEIALRADLSLLWVQSGKLQWHRLYFLFFILSSWLTWIPTSKWNLAKRVETAVPCQLTTNESILTLPSHLWVSEKLFSKYSV